MASMPIHVMNRAWESSLICFKHIGAALREIKIADYFSIISFVNCGIMGKAQMLLFHQGTTLDWMGKGVQDN